MISSSATKMREEAFFVDGKVFCLGNQLSFQDMEKHELAYIKQKLFSWGQTYEIYRDGTLAAVVKKSLFTFFHCTFSVDVPGPNDLSPKGALRTTSTPSAEAASRSRPCRRNGLAGRIPTAWRLPRERTTYCCWRAQS